MTHHFRLGDRIITTRDIEPPKNGNGPRPPIAAGTFGTIVGVLRSTMGPLPQVDFGPGMAIKTVDPHILEVISPAAIDLPPDGLPIAFPDLISIISHLIRENATLKSALITGQNGNGHRAN